MVLELSTYLIRTTMTKTNWQSEIVLNASNQMVDSLKNDDLARDEFWEWYGYIRAIRDMAYELRLDCIEKTQKNLTEALEYSRHKVFKDNHEQD